MKNINGYFIEYNSKRHTFPVLLFSLFICWYNAFKVHVEGLEPRLFLVAQYLTAVSIMIHEYDTIRMAGEDNA